MKLKRPVFIALPCTLLGIFLVSTSVKAQQEQNDSKGKSAMTKHQRDKLEWEKKRKGRETYQGYAQSSHETSDSSSKEKNEERREKGKGEQRVTN